MFRGFSTSFDLQLEHALLADSRTKPAIDSQVSGTLYDGALSSQSDPLLCAGHDPTFLGNSAGDQTGTASVDISSISFDDFLSLGMDESTSDPVGDQDMEIYSSQVPSFDAIGDPDFPSTLGSFVGVPVATSASDVSLTRTPLLTPLHTPLGSAPSLVPPLPSAPALLAAVLAAATDTQDVPSATIPKLFFPSPPAKPSAEKPRARRTKKGSASKRQRKSAGSPYPELRSSTPQSLSDSQSCFPGVSPRVVSFKRRTRRVALAEASDVLAAASSPSSSSSSSSADPSNPFACPFCDYVQVKSRKPDFRRHVKSHFTTKDWLCCGVPVEWAREKYGLSDAVVAAYAAGGRVYEFQGVLMVGGCPSAVKDFSRCDALARHIGKSWENWDKECEGGGGRNGHRCFGECGGHEKVRLPCLGDPSGYWLPGNQKLK
ncbi:hypothetical protein C8Q79DRAFT_35786 [Trametes meyenii]|nr:hypothetical protein C8Q79DRAFT_35786 [Trametes meyenii]